MDANHCSEIVEELFCSYIFLLCWHPYRRHHFPGTHPSIAPMKDGSCAKFVFILSPSLANPRLKGMRLSLPPVRVATLDGPSPRSCHVTVRSCSPRHILCSAYLCREQNSSRN
jgi:hypothetical protein